MYTGEIVILGENILVSIIVKILSIMLNLVSIMRKN